MRKSMIFLVILTLFLSIFNISNTVDKCKAEGNTLLVGVGQEYRYIQDAINASNENDTIYVYSGTYTENIKINKSINIVGENKDTTIIQGIKGNNIIKISKEVPLDYISNVNITNIKILQSPIKNYIGVFVEYANSCKITDCIIKDSSYAIWMKQTDASILINNTIENSETGILLSLYSEGNTIKDNIIINNNIGITLQDYSNNNIIQNNDILEHTKYGLWVLGNCNNNIIYHNDLYNNEKNAYDEGSNTYDNGYSSGGNYWDDYNGEDTDPIDGIGDIPYNIPGGNNQDRYPLGNFLSGQDPIAEIILIYPNPATVGQTIYFYGQGTDDTTIVDWEWKAGSNIIGHQQNLEYSGLPLGSYTISFRVKDSEGIWSSWDIYEQTLIVKQEYVPKNQPPVAIILSITPSTANFSESVYFQGRGEDIDGVVVMYNWSSDIDGLISENPSFTRSNLSIGTHIITFKVKDNNNQWSETKERLITIKPGNSEDNKQPIAITNGPYTGYVNETILFDASESYDIDGLIISYIWNFGDGQAASEKAVNHAFNQSKEYIVTLTVTDDYGLQNITTTKAKINIKTDSDNNQNTKKDNGAIPGFRLIIIIIAIELVAITINYRKKRK
ncbi:MAG: PKD domain-containing protein [Thermoplasmatales archaeon]|nr:MAG: PKD domain-containing protein [Thermoplasmatales archaeon]